MKYIENNPQAASFMESARAIGYSFSTAVSDVIDNSIYAKASKLDIMFDVHCENPYFSILDNGCGMSRSDLYVAMKYGAKSPSDQRDINDLGRFGLGLKTASLSQCRRLTVVSKKSNQISCFVWDLDVVIEHNSWKMVELDLDEILKMNLEVVEKLLKEESGTLVIWRKMDRIGEYEPKFKSVFSAKIERLRDHLSLVFHRYINEDANKIDISLNGRPVDGVDPFIKSNFATQMRQKQIFKVNGESIAIQPYVLPYINKMTKDEIRSLGGKEKLRQGQGYYVYRNKRLIIWGKWFGQYPKSELQKLVRVQIDIPNTLDYLWDIDVKKSQAVLPNIIRKDLGLMINKSLSEGKGIFTYRGRKSTPNINTEFVWDRIDDRGDIKYSINKSHPIVNSIYETTNSSSKLDVLFDILAQHLPYNQIYNDMAEFKDLSKGNIESDNLLLARKIFNFMSKEQVIKVLEGNTNIEALNLTNEEKGVLKGEFINE